MGIRLIRRPATADLVFGLHQRPLLLTLLLLLCPLAPRVHPPAGLATLVLNLILLAPHVHALNGGLVVVHGAQGVADAKEEQHEAALGEAVVVDEVGVDHVLQVAALVVGQEHVDGLGRLVGAALRGHGVVVG